MKRARTSIGAPRHRTAIRLGTSARTTMAVGLSLAVLLVSPAEGLARTYVTRGSPDDTPVYKPRAFVAGSGVGGGVLRLSAVRWSRWGQRSARGKGTFTYNTCSPTCADGNSKSTSARIRLYRPRRGCEIYVNGRTVRTRRRLFTRIELRYDGRTFRSLTSGTQSCQ